MTLRPHAGTIPGVVRVNDVHSQLNETTVADVVRVSSLAELQRAVADAELPVAIAGGRHAMGGQQFCSGGVLLDTSSLARVLEFDRDSATSAAGARPPLRG